MKKKRSFKTVVVGVGGAGSNLVEYMINKSLDDIRITLIATVWEEESTSGVANIGYN